MKKIVVKAMWVIVSLLLTGAYLRSIKDIAGQLTSKGGEPNTK